MGMVCTLIQQRAKTKEGAQPLASISYTLTTDSGPVIVTATVAQQHQASGYWHGYWLSTDAEVPYSSQLFFSQCCRPHYNPLQARCGPQAGLVHYCTKLQFVLQSKPCAPDTWNAFKNEQATEILSLITTEHLVCLFKPCITVIFTIYKYFCC